MKISARSSAGRRHRGEPIWSLISRRLMIVVGVTVGGGQVSNIVQYFLSLNSDIMREVKALKCLYYKE